MPYFFFEKKHKYNRFENFSGRFFVVREELKNSLNLLGLLGFWEAWMARASDRLF